MTGFWKGDDCTYETHDEGPVLTASGEAMPTPGNCVPVGNCCAAGYFSIRP